MWYRNAHRGGDCSLRVPAAAHCHSLGPLAAGTGASDPGLPAPGAGISSAMWITIDRVCVLMGVAQGSRACLVCAMPCREEGEKNPGERGLTASGLEGEQFLSFPGAGFPLGPGPSLTLRVNLFWWVEIEAVSNGCGFTKWGPGQEAGGALVSEETCSSGVQVSGCRVRSCPQCPGSLSCDQAGSGRHCSQDRASVL